MAGFLDFGLTDVSWIDIDANMPPLLASPSDEGGRGIRIYIGPGGSGELLEGADVMLLWRHNQTHAAGIERFEAVAGQLGVFELRWPEAMAAFEGDATCQVVVEPAGGGRISTRAFVVGIEPDVAGWCGGAEGVPFLDVIERCAEAAAEARDVAEALRAAATAGEFDGEPGPAGEKGEPGEKGNKGDPGEDGADSDIVGASATVDGSAGTPAVEVTLGGEPGARTLSFSFTGLKGEQGATADLSAYATRAYVDEAVAGIADLTQEEF